MTECPDPPPGLPMPDTTLASTDVHVVPSETTEAGRTRRSADMARWLDDGAEALIERWVGEILSRDSEPPAARVRIVGRFAQLIVRMLPMMLGPHRVALRPVWIRTAELYGAVAAKRGLAAGEAIEEIHALRELVIRQLYVDAPLDGSTAWPMREILRLNRALDRAVTHASVGHTDTLFFDFFGPSGGRAILDGEDVVVEAERQLEQLASSIREHFDRAWHEDGDEN